MPQTKELNPQATLSLLGFVFFGFMAFYALNLRVTLTLSAVHIGCLMDASIMSCQIT